MMKLRMTIFAGLSMALAACSTTLGTGNPIAARWNGKPAGTFFAQYGPPIADIEQGGDTLYTWRGGYKTVRVPARYGPTENGKRGKRIAAAKTTYLRCEVKLTVDDRYVIRDIRPAADRPGVNGPSYCAEFLAGAVK